MHKIVNNRALIGRTIPRSARLADPRTPSLRPRPTRRPASPRAHRYRRVAAAPARLDHCSAWVQTSALLPGGEKEASRHELPRLPQGTRSERIARSPALWHWPKRGRLPNADQWAQTRVLCPKPREIASNPVHLDRHRRAARPRTSQQTRVLSPISAFDRPLYRTQEVGGSSPPSSIGRCHFDNGLAAQRSRDERPNTSSVVFTLPVTIEPMSTRNTVLPSRHSSGRDPLAGHLRRIPEGLRAVTFCDTSTSS